MKILRNIALFGVAGAFFASCSVTRPYQVTNNPIGSKVGKSETNCIFPIGQGMQGFGSPITSSGMCFNSKYGIADAAASGKISTIATVDVKETNYLFFYKYELIVTGN